ncbi:calcium-dependent protein kinase 7, putative [Plasmodium gallinaceum]|uniref:Calcium-dependent protein kinase 7, putative n=1 Tax=Plasmodium gallinaceum TaxID=5849 RepID=A0A1J1GUT9_PLAGA|nr:calcium-dependent protein kinase 7, putative [Plasmodium gallinaceum]CRG96279.1 calcium-dependent protein kinase 7, putative [Plasmodium gallinaceum]
MGLQTEKEKDKEIQKNYFKICSKKFETDELEVLKKIYKELGSRSGSNYIDKETFLQFFPLPGLWGERLFLKFNFKNTGYIDFEEFIIGIAICCRGTKSDKINVLFDIFDLNSDGYIQKSEMVAMLSNIPYIHKLKNVFFNKENRKNIYDEEYSDIDNNKLAHNKNSEENNIINCVKCSNQRNQILTHNNLLNDNELSKNLGKEEKYEYENFINDTSIEQHENNFLSIDKKSKKEKSKYSKKYSIYKNESDDTNSSSSSATSDFVNDSDYSNKCKKNSKNETRKNLSKCLTKYKSANITCLSSTTDSSTSNDTSSHLNNGDCNSFSSNKDQRDLCSSYSSDSFISIYGYLIKNKKKKREKKKYREEIEAKKSKEETDEEIEECETKEIENEEMQKDHNEEKEKDEYGKHKNDLKKYKGKKYSKRDNINIYKKEKKKEQKKKKHFLNEYCLPSKTARNILNDEENNELSDKNVDVDEIVDIMLEECEFLDNDKITLIQFKSIIYKYDFFLYIFFSCLHEDIWGLQGNVLYGRDYISNFVIKSENFNNNEIEDNGEVITEELYFKIRQLFIVQAPDYDCVNDNLCVNFLNKKNLEKEDIEKRETLISDYDKEKSELMHKKKSKNENCNKLVNFINSKIKNDENIGESENTKESKDVSEKKEVNETNYTFFKKENNSLKNQTTCIKEKENFVKNEKTENYINGANQTDKKNDDTNIIKKESTKNENKKEDNIENDVTNEKEIDERDLEKKNIKYIKKKHAESELLNSVNNELIINQNNHDLIDLKNKPSDISEKNELNSNTNSKQNYLQFFNKNDIHRLCKEIDLLNDEKYIIKNGNSQMNEHILHLEKGREDIINIIMNNGDNKIAKDNMEEKNYSVIQNNINILENKNIDYNKTIESNVNKINNTSESNNNINNTNNIEDNKNKTNYECDFNLLTNSLNDIFSKEIVEFIQASKISFNINDVCKERSLQQKVKYKKTKRNIEKVKCYPITSLNSQKKKKYPSDKIAVDTNVKNEKKEKDEIEKECEECSKEVIKDNLILKNKIYKTLNHIELNDISNNNLLINDKKNEENIKDINEEYLEKENVLLVNEAIKKNLSECKIQNVKEINESEQIELHNKKSDAGDSTSLNKINEKKEEMNEEKGRGDNSCNFNVEIENRSVLEKEDLNKKEKVEGEVKENNFLHEECSCGMLRSKEDNIKKEISSNNTINKIDSFKKDECSSDDNESSFLKKKKKKKYELTKKHVKDINLYSCPNCKGPFLMCPNCHNRYPRFCVNDNKIAMECEYCDCENCYFYNCIYCNFDFQKCLDMIKKNSLKEGILYKIGKHLHQFKARYYILFDNLLYYYDKKRNLKPRGFMFLEGCYVEKISKNEHINKYGFSICHKGTKQVQKRNLYVNSYEEREEWLQALYSSTKQNTLYNLYELHEQLGQGKFSTVYRGINKQTNSEFAIKVIDKRSVSIYEKELLRSEISILRLLRHPNVIYLKEIINTKETLYISMELVKGGELYDFLLTETRLSEIHANKIISQLIKTVAYLHRCGIIHRDIKPENILLTDKSRDAQIKLTDFGLSTLCAPNELLKEPCGTLAYVAPEVITLQGYNHKVDAWSIGIILYLLLSGKLPFPINKNTEMNIQKNYILNFKDNIWKNISSSAKDLISKLLELNVEKRISANEALEHIWIKNPTAVINENSVIYKNEEINILNLQDVSVSTFNIPKYTQYHIEEEKNNEENENKNVFNFYPSEIICEDDDSNDDPVIPLPYSSAPLKENTLEKKNLMNQSKSSSFNKEDILDEDFKKINPDQNNNNNNQNNISTNIYCNNNENEQNSKDI